ncbi:hypothetical protein DXB18_07045 [Clostridium sp. OM02-18AC]|uniref:hypothetical protein n=1 Tax=Clostridium sp. OM02-18AC TaxID=2292311 RepID=UPI000E489CDA|nr:hypothetical protein [Clostridium sp. OM02-18AC]RHV66452.1 hypothetical protein DXB18_07045 [Clostridium sp. OM02-18AC]
MNRELNFEGVDFCMTALFVTILIDQWRKSENHAPAVIGGVSAVLFLLLFGSSRFMLPSLMVTTALLLVFAPCRTVAESAVPKTDTDKKAISEASAVCRKNARKEESAL